MNMKKFCLRRGTRKYCHNWSFHRTDSYTTTDYYLCMGPGKEILDPPESGCFSNSDHRIMKLKFQVDWTTRRRKKVLLNKPTRMKQAAEALDKATDAEHFLRLM